MFKDRAISTREFERIKKHVQIFIITAMPIEETAVISRLTPIADGIIPLYNNYRFGYFGQFLVAHQRTGQATLNAATVITRMLDEFGETNPSNNSSKNFYVLMPGIACGLQRNKDDETIISCAELEKYLDKKAPEKLPKSIADQVQSLLKTEKDKIKLPLFLTPETEKNTSKQFIGDILVATSIKQHDYKAIKPNKIEDRGEKYNTSFGRISFVLEHARNWQNTPEANFGTRRCQVHSGLIISGNELLNHFNRRQKLLSEYTEAIGLEMESAALGASIQNYSQQENSGKAYFIFAKGICDWGVGKSDQWQEKAANASVSLLNHCLDDPYVFSDQVKPTDRKKIAKIFDTPKQTITNSETIKTCQTEGLQPPASSTSDIDPKLKQLDNTATSEHTFPRPFSSNELASSETKLLENLESIESTLPDVFLENQKKLIRKFLHFSFDKQIEIFRKLSLLSDDDRSWVTERELLRRIFERAINQNKLKEILEEIENFS